MACLLDRLSERSERLAITQAISQLRRVDRRLLTLFWHLAERWGRVGTDGVVVPLALTHRMLGQLVGARRPTVSSALRELASATSSSADLMARGCCAAIRRRRRSRARRDSPSRTATRTTCCDPPDSPAAGLSTRTQRSRPRSLAARGTPARRSAVDPPPDGIAKIGAREAAPISEPVAVPAGHELGRAQRGAPAACMSGGSSRDVKAPPNRGTDLIEALGARLNTALT